MPSFESLSYHLKDRIAYLSLNRPAQGNRLHESLILELKKALMMAEESPDVKVVVIRGNGDAFCEGMAYEHLEKRQHFGMQENLQDAALLADLYFRIYRAPKPVIAQIEGNALAEGAGMAAVCDFSFMVEGAKIGFPEVKQGFVPGVVMPFLLRKIGEARTKQLLMGGEAISARIAQDYGLINTVVQESESRDRVYEFAFSLCENNSIASLQLTKKMIADIQSFPLDQAATFAAKMTAHARNNLDYRRGLQALLNQENITW